MKKVFIVLLLATACVLNIMAQSIECKKASTVDASDVGENETAISFVSKQGDWIIKPVVKKGVNDKAKERTVINGGQQYVYEFIADVTKDHERTFILARQGSPLSEQCVAKGLRRGTRVTYDLQEVADSLDRIEIQETGAKGVYPKDGMACVEITTTIDELTVGTEWKKTVEKTENGAIKITVIVNVDQLRNVKTRMDSLANVMSDMENKGEYLEMDVVMKQSEEAEQWYATHSVIMLGGDGIKELPLSIADLGQKEKRRYAVIALQESYDDLLKRARAMYATRSSHLDYGFYDAACIAYDKALGHKEAPTSDLERVRIERNDMAAIRKYVWLMNKALEIAEKTELEKGADAEGVYKSLMARYNIAGKIKNEYPDIQGVDEIRSTTYARLEKHPMMYNREKTSVTRQRQVITGKVVAGNNFYLSIPNLIVYKVDYAGKVHTDTPKTEIGRIHEDGTFSIVLPDDTHYIYIQGEKQTRPVYANVKDMGTIILGKY